MTSKCADWESLKANASQDFAFCLANILNTSMKEFEEIIHSTGLKGFKSCFPSMYVTTVNDQGTGT
jgi:hypothetical protein